MNNALKSFHAIIDGDMSADIVSEVIDTNFLTVQSVQFVWTGDAVGDFNVEVTNNPNTTGPYARTSNDWTPVPFSPQPAAAGVDGNAFINMDHLRAAAMRITFTNTSGSGELQAWFSGVNV